MQWYYADKRQQIGPLSEEQFQTLIADDTIKPKTLVWNPTLTDWQEYHTVAGPGTQVTVQGAGPGEPLKESICSECGRPFPQDEMIQYEDAWVCPDCKPIFVQKLREGVTLAGVTEYAGFWIRSLAKFIDGTIVWVISIAIYVPTAFLSAPPSNQSTASMVSFVIIQILVMVLQIAIGVAYTTWFLGKYGATLGKMACKLKVVTAGGNRVSYLRAFGRHFAEWLSGMIFLVGYIMAAFDREKRTLHDHICNTRVIKK